MGSGITRAGRLASSSVDRRARSWERRKRVSVEPYGDSNQREAHYSSIASMDVSESYVRSLRAARKCSAGTSRRAEVLRPRQLDDDCVELGLADVLGGMGDGLPIEDVAGLEFDVAALAVGGVNAQRAPGHDVHDECGVGVPTLLVAGIADELQDAARSFSSFTLTTFGVTVAAPAQSFSSKSSFRPVGSVHGSRGSAPRPSRRSPRMASRRLNFVAENSSDGMGTYRNCVSQTRSARSRRRSTRRLEKALGSRCIVLERLRRWRRQLFQRPLKFPCARPTLPSIPLVAEPRRRFDSWFFIGKRRAKTEAPPEGPGAKLRPRQLVAHISRRAACESFFESGSVSARRGS